MNSMAKAVACACVMRTISRIAERNGTKLIVGLVTGWMSDAVRPAGVRGALTS